MEKIAVVGNAKSIFDKADGVEIDSRSVIRFNYGVPIKPICQGVRTDLVVTFNPTHLEKIRPYWPEDTKFHVIKQQKGYSTLLCYLLEIEHMKDVAIFGVDYNKSGTYYRDKTHPHPWKTEEYLIESMIERNKWKKF